MFIQVQETPNPETLKFLPGCLVMERGSRDFPNPGTALGVPLAQELFKIEGVQSLFFSTHFVAITKTVDHNWSILKPDLLHVLLEYFSSGRTVDCDVPLDIVDEDDPLVREIRMIIDSRIRPAVAADGGDILFESFEEGIVYVRLHGACSGCPSATETLKSGIENLLRHYVPEVLEVRSIN